MQSVSSVIAHSLESVSKHLQKSESAVVYATASIAPLFVINWGHVIEAIVVSCVSGTIPLLVKHIYRKYVSPPFNEQNENEKKD